MLAEGVLIVLAVLSELDTQHDVTLAKKIKAGDQSAFKSFFDQHYLPLFRFLISRGMDSDEAEDLIQQAFLIIWEKRNEIREERSLRSFLFTIALNRAKNLFRTRQRVERLEFLDDIRADERDPRGNSERVMKDVRRAIEDLPERRKAVFELCFLEGLTYKETADVLEISVKTVEHQMGHALKFLREALKKYV